MKLKRPITHLLTCASLIMASAATALPAGTQYLSGAAYNALTVEGGVVTRSSDSTLQTDGSTASSSGLVSTSAVAQAFAESNLSTGTLRASASVTGYQPLLTTNASAFGDAYFGDSFSHSSGGNPFLFSNGDISRFILSVDGVSNRSTNDAYTSASSFLNIFILEHGTLADNVNETGDIIFVDDSFQAVLFNNLIAHASFGLTPDSTLTTNYGATGDLNTPGIENPFLLVPVDDVLSSGDVVDFAFNPGGDFDWYIQLSAGAAISNGPFPGASPPTGEQFANSDFSNTIHVDYVAPSGVDYGSASGIFLEGSGVSAVPVPAAVWLFGSGLLGLVGVARRKV